MHARDPHHRVDTLHSSRRVQVLAGGQVVADSVRPLLLFETTTLPTRYQARRNMRRIAGLRQQHCGSRSRLSPTIASSPTSITLSY